MDAEHSSTSSDLVCYCTMLRSSEVSNIPQEKRLSGKLCTGCRDDMLEAKRMATWTKD